MQPPRFGLTQTVTPSEEPITLAKAKLWCRIDSDDTSQDDEITELIKAARLRCEKVAGIALVTQTWKLTLDAFPDDGLIRLPRPPLASVTNIKYLDTSGVEQTLATTEYRVDADSKPGLIQEDSGKAWPAIYDVVAAVRVTYVAGYGGASAVPEDIKQRLRAHVCYCYENRDQLDEEYLDRLFAVFSCGELFG